MRRTRRLLEEAVLVLVAEQDLGSITVQDIARHADVNRATFYQHYRDRDDLLEQAFDVLLAELTEECGPVLAGTAALTPDEVPPSVVSMLREIGRRADLYRRLLGRGGSSPFVARFQEHNERLFLQAWSHLKLGAGDGEAPPELRARFAAAAATGAIAWWLERDQAESAEAMATWLWRLTRPAWFESTRLAERAEVPASPAATAAPPRT